jgi:hypothetical protein
MAGKTAGLDDLSVAYVMEPVAACRLADRRAGGASDPGRLGLA